MKHNWLNAAIGMVFLILALVLTFGCAKRITSQSKSSSDSSSLIKSQNSVIDTGKTGSFTRLIGWMPVSSLKGVNTGPFHPGLPIVTPGKKANKGANFDPASWPTDVFVTYLKGLPDTGTYMPFIYENYTNQQKGLSTRSSLSEEKTASERGTEKSTERKTPLPWVAGIAFIIIGIFLIIRIVPRKPKSL